MTHLSVKNARNPNWTISKRKKSFPDSGKTYVLKRKVVKMRAPNLLILYTCGPNVTIFRQKMTLATIKVRLKLDKPRLNFF
jgi:hypothetical protein